MASAYVVLPTNEDETVHVPVTTATATAVDLARPAYRNVVHPEYAHLNEIRDLTWADEFFDDDDDVVAVFDFDYGSMETYYSSLGWTCYGFTAFFPTLLTVGLLGMVPCYLNRNVRWNVRAQHVAVTRDGIRFVHDKHSSCWGNPCSDVGKRSKTIPFDQITDCDIVEPAGNSCLCITNVLSSVHVDTVSSSKGSHEISIQGLEDPHAFKKLVLAMKRATTSNGRYAASLPQALEMADRGDDNNGEVATLLREIRDELRQQKKVLQGNFNGEPPASAPSEGELT